MPLPVLKERFKHFTVDFVISLPSFINVHKEICINVMIIVNCFLKYTTFVPMQKIDAVSVNHTWLTEFYQENSAFDSIVSDYDSQFVSNFWKQVCFCMNIDVKLSTAFHSEIDDQTECINQFLKLYLWEWGDWLQTDWSWWVLIAQFVYNNLFWSVISTALFMTIKGFMPHSETEVLYESETVHTPNHNQKLTDTFIHKMAALKTDCQQNICYTQEHMTEQVNCHWNLAPNYQVRDMVWLNTWNIHNSQHPADKLDMKTDEPFQIIQKINVNAYKLKLLFYWKIHNVFNITCIQWACDDPFPDQLYLISFKSDSDEEFKVKEVLNSNMHEKYLIWLIKWTDFNEFTWHQFSDLIECDEALKHFYNHYLNKPSKTHWHKQLAHLENTEFLSWIISG